jgi:hypothetical protein
MRTPDSETRVRVWKFRIERIFFKTWPYGVRAHPIKKLQRVIVARKQQDFVCLVARDRGASAMFKLNFEGGIWNYRALAGRMNKLARAPIGI